MGGNHHVQVNFFFKSEGAQCVAQTSQIHGNLASVSWMPLFLTSHFVLIAQVAQSLHLSFPPLQTQNFLTSHFSSSWLRLMLPFMATVSQELPVGALLRTKLQIPSLPSQIPSGLANLPSPGSATLT